VTESLLTPSKVTAWLDCAHYLTLRHQVDDGTLTLNRSQFGPFAQLLVDKGLDHEAECLAEYRRQGRSVLEVPERRKGESFAAWIDRIGDPLASGPDVIYQMPFINGGVRGIADFLVRAEHAESGFCLYEPVDAKLARSEGKPGHVLQLCFYADALEAATGSPPKFIHLWLGSGRIQSLPVKEFRPYWNRLRTLLAAVIDDEQGDGETYPEPCAHCEFCEFHDTCTTDWRESDSLTFVAGIRGVDRVGLESSGVETLAQLAVRGRPVEGLQPERLRRLVDQASLQVQTRLDPEVPPPYRMIEPSEDPVWGRGFELMPEPDGGDMFLDFEGDPFWHADIGLFFLFGLIVRDDAGIWEFKAFWAHDPAEEAAATGQLIDFIAARRNAFPDMHVYHYNHTERSSLERLTADHGVGEAVLANLVETGLFVDLYPIVRNSIQAGTESYGLKDLERVTGYVRGHDIDQGSGAVVEYERFMSDHDPERLCRIAAYNEDDVRSTLTLRDWLVERRPEGLPWRGSSIEPEEGIPDLDAQVAKLHEHGPGTPEHLLGDLLGYWLRERRANKAPKVAKTGMDTPTLLDDLDVIAGLTYLGQAERTGKNGRRLLPIARFRWPEQTTGDKFEGATVLYATPDGPTGYASVDRIDSERGELDLIWNQRAQDLVLIPSVVVIDDWVRAKPKPEALSELAAKIIDPISMGPPNAVSLALLRGDRPVFQAGGGPGAMFGDGVEAITRWVGQLDHSYVAIQGPPGTGKTFRGAHIVHRLVTAGQRVGIAAMSHLAIDNLLNGIVQVFEEKGDLGSLHAVRRGLEPPEGGLQGVTYAGNNRPCARNKFNLVAGTTWLYSGDDMKDAPVDVLIVDEAGQLALADTLAASRSAHNLILLGDPLQLSQVSQAAHPGGGGSSVLEHVLGDDVTIPSDRGVFLGETWRMHPDICQFISEQIYEGRLVSHPSCAIQNTEFGTGLRWLEAEHVGCSTESVEEAEMVAAEIGRLVGTGWVDQHGSESPLAVDDFLVVAPYNDQVDLLRAHLDADRRTRGVRVGTVDKFQGREAPVVFFTMTTSSAGDMPRGPDFLFSRNRLNVAVSRARCLAYLVCTENLLNSRARDVDEMRLISTLCSFVEYSTQSPRD
jgi:predicted RecB family nuclease